MQRLDTFINLEKWESGGKVDQAKKTIAEAINNRSFSFLNVSFLNLTTLPAVIGELTNLTMLFLHNNELTSLPTEIGLLPYLSILYVQNNKLTSLPTEIRQLNNLNMSCNGLTSFPMAIAHLTRLTELNLENNRLSSLPTEIGLLSTLTRLALNANELTSLPIEIGQLMSLTTLELHENISLRELPMSLGEIEDLTALGVYATAIDRSVSESILSQCRRKRDAEAGLILPKRLNKWLTIAGRSALEIYLSDDQKNTLNEWLRRLEKTRYFAHLQSALAQKVCRIVEDVLTNKEFQELFFSQAEANNACCEDRAAMSLNEIYTSWAIMCQSADLSLLTGVAKTLCLRKELQKLIKKEERESVEIFLYYESTLREQLQLATAIQRMAYGTIGRRDGIDPNQLINHVNANFFEELFELPVFEKMAMEGCREEWEAINAEFLEKIENQPWQAEILGEWKKKKMAIARAWYEEHYAAN